MTTRTLFAAVLAFGLVACNADGPGAIGVVATALESTCEPGGAPQEAVSRVAVLVTGADPDTGKTVVLREGSSAIAADTQDVFLGSVPAGLDNVVTVLGFAADQDTPSWFGRRREVAVAQDRTTDVEMVLTRYGSSTCIGAPQSWTQRAFSASVVLGDGRVLLTGGFTTATDLGGGSFELAGASNSAYLYDPAKGQVTEIGPMTVARAGHAMVDLPLAGGEKVLVFGGLTKMSMQAGSDFPFVIDATKNGLDSYEVFDVATATFSPAGQDHAGKDKKMALPRAFPMVGRLFDNTVLITGGGAWPSDGRAQYNTAEMWAPYGDKDADGANPKGGLLELNNSLALLRQHNGGALVKLEDTSQGLSRYLVVGGTTEPDATVEIFTQSSKQEEGASGAFRARSVANLPQLFFPAVVPLRDAIDKNGNTVKQFLVAGGTAAEGGKLKAPVGKAWVLTVSSADKVSAEAIDAPCAARFFHTATPNTEAYGATLLGGYSDFTGTPKGGACFFDIETKRFSELASAQADFPRAGHVVARMIDDTLLVAGGLVDVATFSDGSAGLLELFTPQVPYLPCNPEDRDACGKTQVCRTDVLMCAAPYRPCDPADPKACGANQVCRPDLLKCAAQ